jgi:hypothetical protein
VLNDFLQVHQYREVWRNEIFRILIPAGKDSVGGLVPLGKTFEEK